RARRGRRARPHDRARYDHFRQTEVWGRALLRESGRGTERPQRNEYGRCEEKRAESCGMMCRDGDGKHTRPRAGRFWHVTCERSLTRRTTVGAGSALSAPPGRHARVGPRLTGGLLAPGVPTFPPLPGP